MASNTYFVNVDSFYRDNAKYPNPTDFGISLSAFEGTGTFVRGEPLNADSFFQQVSIDPDYIDNNLQFLNATVDQINRTSTNVLVSGVFNFTENFSISYLDTVLYFQTGTVYPTNTYLNTGGNDSFYRGRQMPLPFLVSLSFNSNAEIPYSINWIFYIQPSFVPEVYFNYTSKAGFQITQSNNIYFLFDFCLRQFDFVVWKNNVVTVLASASNPTIDTRLSYELGGNFGNICNCLVYLNQNGDVGIVNGHSYGYHIFSSNYDIDASQINGNISIETDLAESAYVGLTTNPFRAVSKYGPNVDTNEVGAFLGTMYNYESGKNLHFMNATGTVVPVTSQTAFAPVIVAFTTGAYKIGFIIENPSAAYLDFQYVIPEPTPDFTQVVSQVWFTGSNKIFACISSIVGTNVTNPTGSSIFTVDPNTFAMTKVARMSSTGACSVAFAEISSQIYLFNVDLYNFLSVYTFNTSTYAITYQNGIQLPSTYFFPTTVFTIRDGTDVYVYVVPNGAGFNPSTYFRELTQLGFVLKYSTGLNTLTIINSLQFDVGTPLNYSCLNIRRDTGKIYFYKTAFNKNLILVYDITNPYAITKLPQIAANANSNLFPYSQTIDGSTKYYLLFQSIGGANSFLIYDITDVNNNIILGTFYDLKITPKLTNPSITAGPINGYMYSFQYGGLSTNTPAKWKLPVFSQTITSSHARQNLAKTVSATGAVRCSTFNVVDQAYVATISNASLFVYDITSIRSASIVSTIPIGLPTTIYDMQTINFDNKQYFIVCGLGYVFVFYLNSNLASITPVGLFTAVPDAYSEGRFFISNNQLYAAVLSYSSYLYRFQVLPTLSLQAFTLIQAGKIPAMKFLGVDPNTNILTLLVTTSNFTTANDLLYIYYLTNLIFLDSVQLGTPGSQPRSSSQTYNVKNGVLYFSLFANIGIGVQTIPAGSTWLNLTAVNIPTNLNGMTRLFYTDKFYLLTNQYGGTGSLGDYLNIFDLGNVNFGIETFTQPISVGYTGVSTGAPATSLDIQLSQLNDRVTAVMLNNNGTFYLYDISNPEYAGQFQNPNISSSVYDVGISYGAGTIFKLNNEGEVIFNNSLRTSNTGTGPNGQLVNLANIKLSSDGLSIYACGGWKDKIQSYNPRSLAPSNQISTLQAYNGFIAKCDALNGDWIWLIPVYGEGDEYLNKLQYVTNGDKIVVVGYTSSDFCVVYEKQDSGSLVNPTVPQKSIIGSNSITNSFVLSVKSEGTAEWVANSYSNETARFVNLLDIGVQNDKIVVSGNSNASEIFTFEGSGNQVQNLYTRITNITENSIINFTYNLSGMYENSSTFLYPPYTVATCNDIKIFSDLNLVSICPTINYNFITTTQYFNKDGTLAHSDTGPINTPISYIVNYKLDSQYTDINGSKYSWLQIQNPPPPYAFTGNAFTNYNSYILGALDDPVLNKNFSVRGNEVIPSGDYRIILNSRVNVAGIDRVFTEVNGITGSQDYYAMNLSASPLASIFTYNIGAQPTVDNTITVYGLSIVPNTSTSTYFITFPKAGEIVSIIVESITVDANGDYVFHLDDVNDLREYPGGPFYGPYLYLSTFNQSVFYNLQFFPSSITVPVYYTVQVISMTLPNRALNTDTLLSERLGEMPYFFLAIYNVNDQDIPDAEIVNIFYSNNPSRNQLAVFQIPTVDAGLEGNWVTYGTSTVAKIKFLPTFLNLRIKLIDCFGKVIVFDNTATKTTDAKYNSGTVPPELMRMTLQLSFTKIG